MTNGNGNVQGETVVIQITCELPSWKLSVSRNTDNIIIMRGMCDEAILLARNQIIAQRKAEAEKSKIIVPDGVIVGKKG